jgi:hypothetical protein
MLWQTTAALARVFGNHDALWLVGVDHAKHLRATRRRRVSNSYT